MAQSDRAAVRVDFAQLDLIVVVAQPQVTQDGQALSGKRLVQLNRSAIVEGRRDCRRRSAGSHVAAFSYRPQEPCSDCFDPRELAGHFYPIRLQRDRQVGFTAGERLCRRVRSGLRSCSETDEQEKRCHQTDAMSCVTGCHRTDAAWLRRRESRVHDRQRAVRATRPPSLRASRGLAGDERLAARCDFTTSSIPSAVPRNTC